MPRIRDVDLMAYDLRLPSDLVGMVMMQPFLELSAEPFRCSPVCKTAQLAALDRVFDIAMAADHEAGKTHFTLLPEYSIPGLEGVERIDHVLRQHKWPSGSVVIGGIDALSKDDYAELCRSENTEFDSELNGPHCIPDGQWINCAITWVKSARGQLHRWLQPKLAPAWPEKNVQHGYMYEGKSVFLFRTAFANGRPCRFCSLVCFDWIARVQEESIPERLLAAINGRGEDTALSWVFVLEHNDEPCHPNFLSGAAHFFNHPEFAPSVIRDRCALVFANTAGAPKPRRVSTNGCSSLIFSPNSSFDGRGCRQTYSGRPQQVRRSEQLERCLDVVFREGGACIHSISQLVPGSVSLDAAGHSLPLRRALIHSIDGVLTDPRVPGSGVSGCVKWVNDALDELPCLSNELPEVPLKQRLASAHVENVMGLRVVQSQQLEMDVDCATWRHHPSDKKQPAVDGDGTRAPTKGPTADDWDVQQASALRHLVHTADILRLGGISLDFASAATQAFGAIRDRLLEVRAVNGPSHDECLNHATQFVRSGRCSLLVVTRDLHNTAKLKKHKSILQPDSKTGIQAEFNITDTNSGQIAIAFSELMELYLASTDLAEMEGALYARVAS